MAAALPQVIVGMTAFGTGAVTSAAVGVSASYIASSGCPCTTPQEDIEIAQKGPKRSICEKITTAVGAVFMAHGTCTTIGGFTKSFFGSCGLAVGSALQGASATYLIVTGLGATAAGGVLYGLGYRKIVQYLNRPEVIKRVREETEKNYPSRNDLQERVDTLERRVKEMDARR